MAKQVIKWESADGTQHESREEAVRHDRFNALVEGLDALRVGGELDILTAANWILDNYTPNPAGPSEALYRSPATGHVFKVSGLSIRTDLNGEWVDCPVDPGLAAALIANGEWVPFE